jgi:hypothetical protein
MNRMVEFHVRSLVLALAAAGSVSATPSLPGVPRETPVLMIGTVRTVNTTERTIDVLASAGSSGRVVRMQVPVDCRISGEGTVLQLAALRPGTSVRIEYAPPLPRARFHGVAVSIKAYEIMEGAQ